MFVVFDSKSLVANIQLSIHGIRSYEERTSIQFSTPLTLIVGQNGTGKTTIVESVRYATTGDLPPNSKGGAFLHDPKLSGEREVLGQIKLAFVNVNGKEMVCTRSMQLTMKKSSVQFKTLEGNLVVADRAAGTRESVGSKCADLDALMPTFLGASASILNNVIFCHQEESLWPLAEPSVVKKRFDEIFEATKFTKMLEDIKTMKKDIGIEIKLQRQQTLHLKLDAERAAKARARLQELQNDTKLYNEEALQLKIEIEEVTVASKRLFDINQKFQEAIYQLENLREKRNVNEQTVHNLSTNVHSEYADLLEYSDEQLRNELDNFQLKTSNRREAIDKISQSLESKKSDIQTTRRLYNQQVLMKGQLNAEFEVYKDLKVKFEELEAQIMEKLFPSQTEEYTSRESRELALSNAVKELQASLEKENLNFQQDESDIQKRLNVVSAEKLNYEQKKLSATEMIQSLQSEIDQVQSEIDDIHVDEGILQYEATEIEQIEKSQSALLARVASAESNKLLESKKKMLAVHEEELERQNAMLERISRHATENARVELLQEDLSKKQSALGALVEAHRQSIVNAVAQDAIEPIDYDDSMKELLLKLQTSFDTAQMSASSKQREVSELKALQSQAQDEYETKIKECKVLENELGNVLKDFSMPKYQEELAEAEEYLSSVAKSMEQTTFTNDYYRTAIEMVTNPGSAHKCLLCQRKFDDEEDIKKFTDYLESFLEKKLPVTPEEARRQYEEAKADVDMLHSISPKINRLSELKETEIPNIQHRVESLMSKLKSAGEGLELINDELISSKTKLDDATRLKKVAVEISRTCREIAAVQRSIEQENISASSQQTEQVTASEVYRQINELNREIKVLKTDIESFLNEERALQSDLSAVQGRLSNKKVIYAEKEHEFKLKSHKMRHIDDLRLKLDSERQSQREIGAKIKGIEPELVKLKEELNQAKLEFAIREKDLNKQIAEITSAISRLRDLRQQIEQHESKDIKVQLVTSSSKIEEYDEEIKRLESEISILEKEIKSEEKSLLDIMGRERALKDCIELHRLQDEHGHMIRKIQELESQNAEKDKAVYEEESHRLQSKHEKLNSAYSSRMGEIKQMEDQIERLQTELETDYKNVDDDLRRSGCQLEVQRSTDSDLVGFSRAVDRAMMLYHSVNMERINEIISTLWQEAYTGTDVETILIRADNERSNGSSRAMYNYRVCMVKQGIELDMRGRCSAGQKVLACIVIRLALAQCFGERCGIITLDEPTTNLDADNIAALARSLASIIKTRIVQQNFQLVIITHDEHFLRQMHASEYTDHFFRVVRDEHQCSKIKLYHISQITSD